MFYIKFYYLEEMTNAMHRNLILRIAIGFTWLLTGLVAVLAIGFLGMLVHSELNPEAYSRVVLIHAFQAGWGVGSLKIILNSASPELLTLGELGFAMKSWLGIRALLFFGIMGLILKSVVQILRSVQSLSTFYTANISHFRRLAFLGGIGFVLSTFNFQLGTDGVDWHFTFPFGPLAFSLGSLVLAEIFREGQALLEENRSIV